MSSNARSEDRTTSYISSIARLHKRGRSRKRFQQHCTGLHVLREQILLSKKLSQPRRSWWFASDWNAGMLRVIAIIVVLPQARRYWVMQLMIWSPVFLCSEPIFDWIIGLYEDGGASGAKTSGNVSCSFIGASTARALIFSCSVDEGEHSVCGTKSGILVWWWWRETFPGWIAWLDPFLANILGQNCESERCLLHWTIALSLFLIKQLTHNVSIVWPLSPAAIWQAFSPAAQNHCETLLNSLGDTLMLLKCGGPGKFSCTLIDCIYFRLRLRIQPYPSNTKVIIYWRAAYTR